MKQQGQRLDGDNLQEVLDAGTNAARVGRQQFFTPLEIARPLMIPLPRKQGNFVDFTMGDGALLTASNALTLFGCDIDSRLARKPDNALGDWSCINADLTNLYPLLHEIDWRFDLCGLNPPFSVQWHNDRLAALIQSQSDAVADTFASQSSRPTIDSVLATLLIALDRMTPKGEGYLICSQAKADAIMQLPIGQHVWTRLVLEQAAFFKDAHPMNLAVLYFARDHFQPSGTEPLTLSVTGTPEFDVERWKLEVGRSLSIPATQRYVLRKGTSILNTYDFCPTTGTRWKAVAEEIRRERTEADAERQWNIWLEKGVIHRHLTPFQKHSVRIPKARAMALDRLHGQSPLALVVQRDSRCELLAAVHSPIWRVQPELVTAVEHAVAAYNSHRAPLYRLNEVQRLGYLDEEDTILCKLDGLPGFRRGESYPITSTTISVTRHLERPNLLGVKEKVTLSGKELCFTIVGDRDKAHKFSPPIRQGTPPKASDLAADCAEPDDTAPLSLVVMRSLEAVARDANTPALADPDHHDLDVLIKYFRIPEVPDVTQVQPERYAAFLRRVDEIEAGINQRLAA